jgi:TRAP-type mannitol/chloroaromatic compound transport system permease small subunit
VNLTKFRDPLPLRGAAPMDKAARKAVEARKTGSLGKIMAFAAFVVRAIWAINTLLGRIFSLFSLGIVLICFAVVVMRYAFQTGSVLMQDLYVWMNGMMFMGIAGYTMLKNGHVRVDIFYREAALRKKALIDMFGAVFFIAPYIAVLWIWTFPYVQRSWGLREGSANFGGMPGLYILKSFLLVFAAVIALQALAMFLRGVLVLAGREELLPEAMRYEATGG